MFAFPLSHFPKHYLSELFISTSTSKLIGTLSLANCDCIVYRTGLVAELRKNSSDIDAELKFYNPPQMLESTLNLKSSLLMGPIPTV
jgi:hypothetical protein